MVRIIRQDKWHCVTLNTQSWRNCLQCSGKNLYSQRRRKVELIFPLSTMQCCSNWQSTKFLNSSSWKVFPAQGKHKNWEILPPLCRLNWEQGRSSHIDQWKFQPSSSQSINIQPRGGVRAYMSLSYSITLQHLISPKIGLRNGKGYFCPGNRPISSGFLTENLVRLV